MSDANKTPTWVTAWLTFLVLLTASATVRAQADLALVETRYCETEPKRSPAGHILRRADVLRAFMAVHPCPATGSRTGVCPGWAMDHIIPLAVGGCDAVNNLQWLPDNIKNWPIERDAEGNITRLPKDRFERKIYLRIPRAITDASWEDAE